MRVMSDDAAETATDPYFMGSLRPKRGEKPRAQSRQPK
jgi:hypothetical protein